MIQWHDEEDDAVKCLSPYRTWYIYSFPTVLQTMAEKRYKSTGYPVINSHSQHVDSFLKSWTWKVNGIKINSLFYFRYFSWRTSSNEKKTCCSVVITSSAKICIFEPDFRFWVSISLCLRGNLSIVSASERASNGLFLRLLNLLWNIIVGPHCFSWLQLSAFSPNQSHLSGQPGPSADDAFSWEVQPHAEEHMYLFQRSLYHRTSYVFMQS